MTAIELVVAAGVGCMVLCCMAVVFANSSRSFVALGNYINMDQTSRNALDKMTRDIRMSRDLTNFTSSKLVFNYVGTTNMTLQYDPSSRKLVQIFQWGANQKTNVLLTECDSLKFSMYKNVALSGGSNATTTVASEGKLVGVAWRCSRTLLGKKFNTEDMQEAQIVIRNKKVL